MSEVENSSLLDAIARVILLIPFKNSNILRLKGGLDVSIAGSAICKDKINDSSKCPIFVPSVQSVLMSYH